MFVIVTYDIDLGEGGSRLRKVAKVCENYGYRVQKSVFEMDIDPAQLTILVSEIRSIVDQKVDSVRIYKCGRSMKGDIEVIGKEEKIEVSSNGGFFL